MAKIKLKFGSNEIELDSRDFYFDNESVGEVIAKLSEYMNADHVRIIEAESTPEETPEEIIKEKYESNVNYLKSLEDAEIYEPEFSRPAPISADQIKEKIQVLTRDSFFDSPRIVSEVVGQLHEYGWIAVPLDVSKVLSRMSLSNELEKESKNNRCYYSSKQTVLAS